MFAMLESAWLIPPHGYSNNSSLFINPWLHLSNTTHIENVATHNIRSPRQPLHARPGPDSRTLSLLPISTTYSTRLGPDRYSTYLSPPHKSIQATHHLPLQKSSPALNTLVTPPRIERLYSLESKVSRENQVLP